VIEVPPIEPELSITKIYVTVRPSFGDNTAVYAYRHGDAPLSPERGEVANCLRSLAPLFAGASRGEGGVRGSLDRLDSRGGPLTGHFVINISLQAAASGER
jgi:hypothetical protein